MNHTPLKLVKASLLFAMLAASSAMVATVHAEQEIRQVTVLGEKGNRIRVINNYDKSLTEYRVNGKQFRWQQLSQQQQDAIAAAESRLDNAEQALQGEEYKLQIASDRIEAKAEEIEFIADKIEDLFDGVDYDEMTLKQIRQHKEQISEEMDKHKIALKLKDLEMSELEKEMFELDPALIERVKSSARQYERVLLAIATDL